MNIAIGARGDEVKLIQTALYTMGYSLGPEGVDGIFGQHTQAAVMQFQQDHGLTVDGIVGPQTAQALSISLDGNQPAPAPDDGTAPQSSSSLKWLLGLSAVGWAVKKFILK